MAESQSHSQYDPEALKSSASRAHRRAGSVAILYAFLGLMIGAPLGASAMVAVNVVQKVNDCRSREDVSEMLEEKRELLHRAPFGALAAGALLGALGFVFGLQRASALRMQGQTALCLVQIESSLRGRG